MRPGTWHRHYLHWDAHAYHIGGVDTDHSTEIDVRIPVSIAPASGDTVNWQVDATTSDTRMTVFDAIRRLDARAADGTGEASLPATAGSAYAIAIDPLAE